MIINNNSSNNSYDTPHYSVTTTNDNSDLQNQKIKIATTKQTPSFKRILIIDDHYDTTLTFKAALESCNNTREFEVYTYNDPLAALLEFKPNFYDLLLIDINLPSMNGFELYEKISKLDLNVKVCFMSAGEVNHEAIREIHPSLNIGCFMQKPVTIEYLIKRVKAELE
ncbi:MAG: response regulator [Nitrososphaeraceae archaeon]|nr:response regulator [Nitrososphaeraceae archaeon]MBV9667229.1 response regulator [Nitrososphaeraceae archaeon]